MAFKKEIDQKNLYTYCLNICVRSDFALLRTWADLPNGVRVIAVRSVVSPRIPEQKGFKNSYDIPVVASL